MKKKGLLKRIAVIAMTTAMTIGLIACGDKSESKEEASASSETAIEAETEAEASAEEPEAKEDDKGNPDDWPHFNDSGTNVIEVYNKCEDLSEWGYYGYFTTTKTAISIKFPKFKPFGKKFVAPQNVDEKSDEVIVFVPIRDDEEELLSQITDEKSILPAVVGNPEEYYSPVQDLGYELDNHIYEVDRESVSMTVDSSELETVGQYDCCKCTGTMTCKDSELFHEGPILEHTYSYVAYATFTKVYHEPFYWIVIDYSDDQSKADMIADDARKMGYTIAEIAYR
ncbi:hypothetical protein SAMN02910368_02018 [Lachnospiraceae bacterium G11]|nr:hypothetical protein SAMN02910368_02018 [Lachnospiraceae bacterium G11]